MPSTRALFLAPECPYPMVGGGALRTASVLEYLARHYEVDAIVFRQPRAAVPSFPDGLVRDCKVLDLPIHSKRRLARVVRNAGRMVRRVPPLVDRFAGFGEPIARFLDGRQYALGVVEHFWCAPYWERIAPHCESTVLDLHNIESAWHGVSSRTAGRSRALAHRIFEDASLELEREWLPRYSLLLASSDADARRVRRLAPRSRIGVYPNTIPFTEQPRPVEQHMIAFSGTFDYDPNQSAVRFFRERVWPALRERWPRLTWRLVGRHPEAVRHLIDGDSRIECTGAVDNAIDELAAAQVAVVPLLAGSGTRLKIIEAWAAGRAVVSTTVGAEGLPARHGRNIMIEDEPRRFANAVSSLLESSVVREQLGRAGRELYETELTWAAAWIKLGAELQRL